MNEHESIRKLLPLAVADALDLEEAGRVEQHARICEDCRREFETWSRYAQSLRQLSQPSVPAGLLQRTRSRILQQEGAATSEPASAILLGMIAMVGWAAGFILWVLVRGLTGAAANPLWWWLLMAVLTWITAAASAMALVRRRDVRSTL